jgi:hypothetical protein
MDRRCAEQRSVCQVLRGSKVTSCESRRQREELCFFEMSDTAIRLPGSLLRQFSMQSVLSETPRAAMHGRVIYDTALVFGIHKCPCT